MLKVRFFFINQNYDNFTFCEEQLEDKKYRKFVKLLKGQIKSKKLTPEDILSVEEIKLLINVATSEQDRAIVSILYESGMRIGEFVALNISNVKIIEKDVIISVPNLEGCKTDYTVFRIKWICSRLAKMSSKSITKLTIHSTQRICHKKPLKKVSRKGVNNKTYESSFFQTRRYNKVSNDGNDRCENVI
jgi:hypothetical protein